MNAIFKRELKSYFSNMTGYIFIAFLLMFTGIFVSVINLFNGLAPFEYALESSVIVFLFIVPILTMRSIAEEKHSGTDHLLYALPISDLGIVMGKFLALIAVLTIPTLFLAFYPTILGLFGTVHFLGAYSCLLGFFLLGAALISICLFISSTTESQIISAVVSFGTLLILYFISGLAAMIPSSAIVSLICIVLLEIVLALIGLKLTSNKNVAAIIAAVSIIPTVLIYMINSSLFEGLITSLLGYAAIFDRFNSFSYGIFDVSAIVYYICVTVFFIFLTVQSVGKKRWS